MDGKKVYQIQINGITESVSAVEALNKQLDALEKRIKTLESSNVKINTSGGGSKASTSSLNEEEKIAKQIEQIDSKREAYSKEIYQNYLAAKDVLKETVNDQKQLAAQERLSAGNYSNTMQGLKQELADLKSVMQTTDLADDSFGKMTSRANELNEKLKDIEKSYGQFGRDVGNYANGVAEGLQKVKVNVGGTVREFDNARQAAKTLGNELKTLAVNGEQGTEKFKELQKAVAQLNSDIKDATVSSKAMDNLLDTMQSFAALGSISQGFSALFGFDDAEIQKSIQKLVALQNVMQGIEKINQQMNSAEGIGGWIAKGNSAIDAFTQKLLGANKAQEALNVTTKAGATASEALTAAETAQATATAGATVATKALSLALKTLGIGLIVSAVAYLVTYWKDIYKWFTDTIPVLKNLNQWFDKIKAVMMGVGSVVVNYVVQPFATLAKTIQAVINGNFSEIPKIIGEGLKKTYNIAGNFQKGYNKEIERQQEAHNKKLREQQKKANEEWLKDEEAKYGQSHKRTQEYLKKQMALTEKGSDEYKELQRRLWEDQRKEREENSKKNLKNAKKIAKEEVDIEKEMVQLRISAMKEGLNKTITQLEEERKQRLEKIKKNSKYYAEVNQIYDKKIYEAKQEWGEKIKKTYRDMWDEIFAYSLETTRKITEAIEDAIDIGRRNYTNETAWFNQNISSYGIQGKNQLSQSTQFDLQIVSPMNSKMTEDYKKLFDLQREAQTLDNEVKATQERNRRELIALEKEYLKAKTQIDAELQELERTKIFYSEEEYEKLHYALSSALDKASKKLQDFDKVATMNLDVICEEFKNAEKAAKDFEAQLNQTYTSQEEIAAASVLKQRLAEESYSKDIASLYKQRSTAIEAYWQRRISFEISAATESYNAQKKLEDERFQAEEREAAEHAEDMVKELKEKYDDGLIPTQKKYDELLERYITEHSQRVAAISEQHNQNLIKLEQDKSKKIQDITAEAYEARLQELRDFQTAVANLEAKQPVTNSWGIIDLKETAKNNVNLLNSYKELSQNIINLKRNLQEQLNKNEISFDDFQKANRELDNFVADVGQKMDKVKHELSIGYQVGAFIQSINQYVQAGLQAVQTVMNALADYQDYQFEKEQEMLEKENDLLEKKLDEQQDIVEKHKSAIDSIEDELATSRGDRRQHLIDQLNAEMAAQREAQKEEQKIQKQKEANEKKQEELEKKRKQAEYKRNLLAILVSTAMATANGLATQPFVPVGIAMGALATTLGMVQYALAAKAKPYAKGGQLDGGVAQGNRHRDGGIKVLGGRAEIEGGEFITNRTTTAKNIDLLEYINSKKTRVDINDLLEFYNGNAIKKSVRSVRTKFEDGGYIPTLPSSLDIRDQLQNIVVNQDNRPIYVSVVDINNKQDDVRRVQTLAGL